MTLAIAHKDGDTVRLDFVAERRAPFSPDAVVAEFARVLRSYRITRRSPSSKAFRGAGTSGSSRPSSGGRWSSGTRAGWRRRIFTSDPSGSRRASRPAAAPWTWWRRDRGPPLTWVQHEPLCLAEEGRELRRADVMARCGVSRQGAGRRWPAS